MRRNNTSKKKLAIILGDGDDPIKEIKPPALVFPRKNIRDAGRIVKSEDLLILWKLYERARFRTSNQCPSSLLFLLTQLASSGIISEIITTNYDSSWRSIKKRKAHQISINPVPRVSPKDGYYERAKPGNLPVFLIHGQLDFARFQCGCRSQLPSFIQQTTFTQYPRFASCPSCSNKKARNHDIDWLNFDFRKPYQLETRYIKKKLRNAKAILVLGFKGFYTGNKPLRDEEIVPELKFLEKKGIPVFVITSAEQAIKIQDRGVSDHLIGMLEKKENSYMLKRNEKMAQWFRNILVQAGFPVWSWMNIYSRRWEGSLFMDRNDEVFESA